MVDAQTVRRELTQLAGDHRWTWMRSRFEILATLPGWTDKRHPAAIVAELDDAVLENWEGASLAVAMASADRHERDSRPPVEIAYLSPEFAISELVPQYSGGLGVLAGDHLKAATDAALPIIGVGLFYDEGYFRQVVNRTQSESYELLSPESLGFADTGVIVPVELGETTVEARVWRLCVGLVDLLALHVPGVCDRLYGGDRRHRLEQELVLGVGGARALAALGINPGRYHLNEGHAGFALLERLQVRIDGGSSFAEAVASARAETLFTTHTPVPAGIERFDRALITPYLAPWANRLGVTIETLLDLGSSPDDGPDQPFNLAVWCLQLAGRANGVSALHGAVSRELFSATPGAAAIGHVTNGVHARTWVSPRLAQRYDEALGAGWDRGAVEAWSRVAELSDAELAADRRAGRLELAADIHERTGRSIDPDVLTIGFARRFSTYKRAALLLHHRERLVALLTGRHHPVQFVFAGKAHPADDAGKALIEEIVDFAGRPEANGRFHFVPDYDMGLARSLYAGCDVWLNNPVRPQEACGTSGMKAALNGGLNCSVLDGWWDEWFAPEHGWAIPTSASSETLGRDIEESAALHHLLATQVVPTFGVDGGATWWARVRAGLMDLGPKVTAARMIAEYRDQWYS